MIMKNKRYSNITLVRAMSGKLAAVFRENLKSKPPGSRVKRDITHAQGLVLISLALTWNAKGVFISKERLAFELGLSDSAVKDAITAARDHIGLRWIKIRRVSGGKECNSYDFRHIDPNAPRAWAGEGSDDWYKCGDGNIGLPFKDHPPLEWKSVEREDSKDIPEEDSPDKWHEVMRADIQDPDLAPIVDGCLTWRNNMNKRHKEVGDKPYISHDELLTNYNRVKQSSRDREVIINGLNYAANEALYPRLDPNKFGSGKGDSTKDPDKARLADALKDVPT